MYSSSINVKFLHTCHGWHWTIWRILSNNSKNTIWSEEYNKFTKFIFIFKNLSGLIWNLWQIYTNLRRSSREGCKLIKLWTDVQLLFCYCLQLFLKFLLTSHILLLTNITDIHTHSPKSFSLVVDDPCLWPSCFDVSLWFSWKADESCLVCCWMFLALLPVDVPEPLLYLTKCFVIMFCRIPSKE